MKLKAYFEVYSWTEQSNIFFFGNLPTSPVPDNCKRYCAEIEVPDFDANIERVRVNSVEEI